MWFRAGYWICRTRDKPLYLDTLAQLQAAPDDDARREIVTALTEKLKAWLAAESK